MLRFSLNISTVLNFIFIGSFILLLTVDGYLLAEHAYIIFSVVPLFYFFVLAIYRIKASLSLGLYDLYWVLFLIICGLSFFWAIDKALVWHDTVNYIILWVWMLGFRIVSEDLSIRLLLSKILSLILIILIIGHFYILFSEDFNAPFIAYGRNWNYNSVLMVALCPFILLWKCDSNWVKIVQGVILISVFALVIFLGSNGSVLASGFLLVFMGGIFVGWKKSILALFFISVFGLIISKKLHFPSIVEGNSIRYYIDQSSIIIFIHNWISGIGIGNLDHSIYFRNVEGVEGLNHPWFLYRFGGHNIYAKIMAELGLMGVIPILLILSGFFREIVKIRKFDFDTSVILSVFVILLNLAFYRNLANRPFYFSAIALLLSCLIGLISYKEIFKFKRQTFIILVMFCSMGLIGHSYQISANSIYANLSNESEQKESRSKKLIGLYNSYVLSRIGKSRQSLLLDIAKAYEQENYLTDSDYYFREALLKSPNDESILLNYCQFLLTNDCFNNSLDYFIGKLLLIQPNFSEYNLIAAENAINKGKVSIADKHLNLLYSYRVDTVINRTNLLIEELDSFKKNNFSGSKFDKE